MIWIIDASVAVRWLLKDEEHPNSYRVLQAAISQPNLFAVPELFCFEVFSVLCKLHPAPVDAFLGGILPIVQSGIFRQPMTESLARNAGIITKKGLSGYDASYVALAIELEGIWLTFDKKAHNHIKELGISHLLSDKLPDNWDKFF